MRYCPFVILSALAFVPGAVWPQGNPAGPEFRVNTYTPGGQTGASVAADSAGNFVVVWFDYSQDGSFFGVFGQRYASSGTPLGPEFRVNTHTTLSQWLPAVTSDPGGNFVVVWASGGQDGSEFGIFGQRYASSGAPLGPEFRVNTYTIDHQLYPDVAADSAGNFIVVWHGYSQDGSYIGVFGQRYANSGTPLGPEFRVNTYTTSYQGGAAVTSDPGGNFVVVWTSTQEGSGFQGVFGQRYASSGAPLGPEFRVNTYTTNTQRNASVASDSSGNFVVVWSSFTQDGSLEGVFGQRYASAGASLGPEFRVNTYTPDVQWYPAVASDPGGNFVVVWSSFQDGSAFGIFGQRYASSGVPLGPEFRANTYTTGEQLFSSVAADSAGNFIVVWRSSLQDGSDGGVFGQRYRQIVPVELMRVEVE